MFAIDLDDAFTLVTRTLVLLAALVAIRVCIRLSEHEDRRVRWSARLTVFPLAVEAVIAFIYAFGSDGPLEGWARPLAGAAIAFSFAGMGILSWSLAAAHLTLTRRVTAYRAGLTLEAIQRIEEVVRLGENHPEGRDRDAA